MQTAPQQSQTWRMVTVAALSGSLISLQILLTRIFSVVFMSHLGFAAISIGMLGLAAAGVRIYAARERYEVANTPNDVARLGLYAAVSLVVCVFALTRLGANSLTFSWSLFAQLALIYPLAVLPFYFGGLALSLMLTQYQERFAQLYAADLLGAGLGGLCALALLPTFGGPGAVVVVAVALAILAFVSTAPTHTLLRRMSLCMAAAGALLLALDSSAELLHVKNPKGKQRHPILEKWNAFSRVAVYLMPQVPWSLGPKYPGHLQVVARVDIDSSAATSIARADDKEGNAYFGYELTSAVYEAAHHGDTLVIGAGGGRDVLTALLYGQQHVDAVEINPIIVDDVMRGAFAESSGYLYNDPRVDVYIGDGRSYIRHTSKLYDVIELSLVDTWAATAAGAFALAENNLYTVEALRDYIQHLKPNGMLTFSRWSGRDVWRLLVELREVCTQLGIDDLAAHVTLIETRGHSGFITSLIFQRSPMDATTIAALQRQIDRAGFHWWHNPLDDRGAAPSRETQILKSTDPATTASAIAGADLRPSTDDWPFFFYHPEKNFWQALSKNPGTLFVKPEYLLIALLLLSVFASIVCVAWPLVRSPHVGALRENRAHALAAAPYFASLGLGFMFVEVAMAQRFVLYLGHPTYALTVVLTSLLVGAGLGSLSASRLEKQIVAKPSRVGWLALAATVLLLASAVVHPLCFVLTQGLAFWLRVTITAVLLIPLAMVLGMLMPSAIACLHRSAPSLVPWAWGLNGFLSVVGSCGAALCAMNIGFTRTFAIAALFYAVAAVTVCAGGLSERMRVLR